MLNYLYIHGTVQISKKNNLANLNRFICLNQDQSDHKSKNMMRFIMSQFINNKIFSHFIFIDLKNLLQQPHLFLYYYCTI